MADSHFSHKSAFDLSYFEEILDATDFAKEKLLSTLPEGKNGFVFVTMGAGDNWKLGTKLIEIL